MRTEIPKVIGMGYCVTHDEYYNIYEFNNGCTKCHIKEQTEKLSRLMQEASEKTKNSKLIFGVKPFEL